MNLPYSVLRYGSRELCQAIAPGNTELLSYRPWTHLVLCDVPKSVEIIRDAEKLFSSA